MPYRKPRKQISRRTVGHVAAESEQVSPATLMRADLEDLTLVDGSVALSSDQWHDLLAAATGPGMPPSPTLSSKAYAAIRMAIATRLLVPGHIYSENFLADRLSVSRTPVREALARLAGEGLVDVTRQHGFHVRSISAGECQEFYALRELLEGFVVETICDQHHGALRKLERIVQQQELALDDPIRFIVLDEDLHLTMARIAGLGRTSHIIESLRGILWLLGTAVAQDLPRRKQVIHEHRDVVAALVERDKVAAKHAIAQHMAVTRDCALLTVDSPLLDMPRGSGVNTAD